MDIILAAVIMKTLRVHHIFKTLGTVSRISSDLGHFILFSSIVSVNIPMLIAWASLDAARLVDVKQIVFTTVPPYILKWYKNVSLSSSKAFSLFIYLTIQNPWIRYGSACCSDKKN